MEKDGNPEWILNEWKEISVNAAICSARDLFDIFVKYLKSAYKQI